MTPTKPRSRWIASITLGAALSLTPLLPTAAPTAVADSPAVAVTGLSRGARGEAVRTVQQALVGQGMQVAGGVDGIFGPGTEAAVKDFQRRHGLNASGVVDEATALALGLVSSPVLGLTQGNRGDAVRSLQQKLVNAGVDVAGGVDGIFGPATKRAVETFQKQKGLSPTGVVNAATAAALGGVSSAPATTTDSTTAASTTTNATTTTTDDTAAAADPDRLRGLKIGARGDAVKTLQKRLMAAGFTVVGGADGIFGALTSNAVKSFQNANRIGVSGVVDDATLAALATVDVEPDTHAPSATNPYVGLRYGSIGADVKSLQSALMGAGITVRGGADGIFGPATQAAVKRFQQQMSLTQTGRVDADTANALSSGATAQGGSSLHGLKAGALGNTVKKLQQALMDAGINVRGGADGIFGPATANALREFQTSQGIAATGVVDDATVAALANPKQPTAPKPTAPAATAGGFAVFGEKGQRVVALQEALVKAGISVRGGVDGQFGGGTSAAVMDFQRANGLQVTGKVSDETAAKLGLRRMEKPATPAATALKLAAFPVEGPCHYADTYGFPRSAGRVHLGVDIIAPAGKKIYAVADGTITKVYTDYRGSLAGNGVRLTMADGTYFFYAHMLAVADGLAVGTKVKAGQVIGTVGSTGNSGTNHLHLEVHPKGGSAANPYPLVKAVGGC